MKIINLKLIAIIFFITLIGGFLRFYKITQNPPSLTGDEISFGYSAYSVLKTGYDEHGKFLPLTFESIGDYKNPLPVYLMIPSIKFFGLTDFAIRFPNALIGTLSIPIFFFFLLDIFKKKNIAILGSFFLAISSWHIFYSRFAYEAIIASLFILLGTWFYIKMLNGKVFWAVLSAFFFTLTMYTAFAPRLFVPIFVFALLVISFPKIKTNWKIITVFVITCIVLGLPLIYTTLFQGAGTRFRMVFLSNDIEFSRYILLKYFNSVSDIPMLLFFWIKRYLGYLDPGFIFFNGLEATNSNPIGLGIYYVFEIPFFIAGIISLIKNKVPYKSIFVFWILVGILPDSLTNNQKHTGRLLHLFPILIIITSLGVIELYGSFIKIKNKYLKYGVASVFGIVAVTVLIHAFLIYTADFPRDKGESFDEGWREVAYYIGDHQNNYDEIVIDPRRGIAAPDMVSNPFLYVLFYMRYDPKTYQTETKIMEQPGGGPYYKFGKYTFRHINWQIDREKRGILFVGSLWSFPQEGLKEGELLHKIYLSNGFPAFYIVAPK
jgi:4-amino-4-deoxy-L-arabinose transferase-like glycosyltransferase